MEKVKNIMPWLIILLYIAVLLPLTAAKKKEVKCSQVNINIISNNDNYFVEKEDIIAMLNDKGEKLTDSYLSDINVNKLEEFFRIHPSIKNAEVYRTFNGAININIEQRSPVIRIINKRNESFYLDSEGKAMPLSDKYSSHVLIASGNIDLNYTTIIISEKNNKPLQDSALLNSLYTLANFINSDKFWNAQIEQIYVTKHHEFELVPRVGTQIIEFGTIDNYHKKFRNLKALYEQGFAQTGWNKYKRINLKYHNQVICTRK